MALTTIDLSNLDGSDGFRLNGASYLWGLHTGATVSSAGDMNGDGFDEVMIGAPYEYRNFNQGGRSYVVFGKSSGFDAVKDLANLAGAGFHMWSGRSPYLVNEAGDINGDGFDDVIIGDVGFRDFYAPYTITPGAAYVIYGKASGFSTFINLQAMDGDQGSNLNVGGSMSMLPSVGGAGDVNGDGFDDVIVNNANVGYVVFGQADELGATLDLSLLDGKSGFHFEGHHFINFHGDINGDGFDDLIVSERDSGFAYVVFGKSAGFENPLDLSSLDGSNGFKLIHSENNSFHPPVSSAGDINGDGFDDMMISDGLSDVNGYHSGFTSVVFGKATVFGATFDVSDLDGNNGFRLVGDEAYDLVGISASGAGDVNGDGFDDLIIGDPTVYIGVLGVSYVVFGRSDFGDGQLLTIFGTPDDDVLRGTSAAEIFEAGDGNDIMIGRGGADVFRGGAGVDQIKVPDLNFASIDGGTGTDILHLDGKDLNLDLASFGDKIQGIETICIYGRGDNTLSLTSDSVLNLSDTSNTLKLHGNAGDRVTVQDEGWVDGGVKGFYHTYTNDDAVLLVGANLMTEFVTV